ncbi:MAG: sensor histidine kinase [Acutalibacteraceae bacterium]
MQVLYAVVFIVVLYLDGAPPHAILYAAVICGAAEFAVQLANFLKFRRTHIELISQEKRIIISCDELPAPQGLIARDYDKLVRILYNERRELISGYDREKSDMTDYYTTWAHQIKTPIAAMNLILQGEDSPLSREIGAELFRIEQYVEMVLAYLRTGSQSTDYIIKKYSLESIVKQAVRKYAPLFIRKKISLNLEPINATVITDEKWLCFVIEQIISNAIKYTSSGSISIHAEGNGSCTALIVSDTGIGIAAEDLPRVFDNGFTGCNGRRDKKATGIGLYLSKKILDRLGHKISIQSAAGVGTAVRIEFIDKKDILE